MDVSLKQYTLSNKGKQIKIQKILRHKTFWSGQIAYKCIIAIQPGPAE